MANNTADSLYGVLVGWKICIEATSKALQEEFGVSYTTTVIEAQYIKRAFHEVNSESYYFSWAINILISQGRVTAKDLQNNTIDGITEDTDLSSVIFEIVAD